MENPVDIMTQLDEAFNRKDSEAVLQYYEDDAVVVTQPGKTASGKQELKKFFETLFGMNAFAKQETMKVIEAGDIALFISKWQLSIEDPNGNSNKQTLIATIVFRKNSAGKWRLIIDNSFGPAILEA